MKPKFAVLLMTILVVCGSCKSRLEKARELLDFEAGHAKQEYFNANVSRAKDPLAFAKAILSGSYDAEIKQWYPTSGRVFIMDAINNRWIYLGMTYDEVKAVVGSASSTSKTNGRVEYAYYDKSRTKQVQLCFDNWGELCRINE